MSEQNQRDPHEPGSPKDRESDDLIPDGGGGQQGDKDRANVIPPLRPADIPPGDFPPHLPAPHNAPPVPVPHDPPALGGDSTLDPD